MKTYTGTNNAAATEMKQGILVRWRGTVHVVHGRTPTGLVKIWDGKQMRSVRRDNLKFVTKPYKVTA